MLPDWREFWLYVVLPVALVFAGLFLVVFLTHGCSSQ